jgi:hypothetical protein
MKTGKFKMSYSKYLYVKKVDSKKYVRLMTVDRFINMVTSTIAKQEHMSKAKARTFVIRNTFGNPRGTLAVIQMIDAKVVAWKIPAMIKKAE